MQHQWHAYPVEEVLEKLKSDKEGLTDEQVIELRHQYGFNEIPESKKQSWIKLIIKQLKSLLIFILGAAAIISALIGNTADSYIILVVITINATIGFIQEYRAERAAASLKKLLTPTAKVLRSGTKRIIPARELVPGDIIILEEGDSVPADARLIEARNLRAIEASLTGESVPVNKKTIPLAENTSLADRLNMVFKGTFIAGGYAVGVVTETGINTAIGNIAQTLQTIKTGKTNFQKKTDKLALQMSAIAVASASLLFIIAYFFYQASVHEILLISIAAFVSSIPEGLPAVLAIVLAIGAYRMSQRKAIIREFTATETLGAVTTIITDKTGTLTQNTLTVRNIFIYGDSDYEVTGSGWSPEGDFFSRGEIIKPQNNQHLQQLLLIAGWSNNADIHHDKEKNIYSLAGDPTEGALLALAIKGGKSPKNEKSIIKTDDFPFSSALKMRATLIETEGKKQLLVVGAPEQVLEKSLHIMTPNEIIPITEREIHSVRSKLEAWSNDAMRVIALAYKDMPYDTQQIDEHSIEKLVFAGMVGMIDPPRPEVKNAVALCKQAGIRVIMATGDHINTAIAIAKATGIIDADSQGENFALTEKQLLALDEAEFEKAVARVNVFARLTPDTKLRIAEKLQQRGELIAMTGDGVNDAPALKKADVGVSMGIMGTDVARDASKVVLADDNFSTIVSAIEEGRIVFTNARQTSFFLVTTNFAEITTLITAITLGLPVPLTATQILWLNLVTDGVCDISLATESGHGDVLQEKPVNPKENILNKSVVPLLIINASLMSLLAISVFKWYLPYGVEKARTAAFITMAFCQLFNVFNVRSLKLSVFKIGMFTNKYINISMIVSVIIQTTIIEVPFFEKLFQFEPVSFFEFITFISLASLILWAGETYKYIRGLIHKKSLATAVNK